MAFRAPYGDHAPTEPRYPSILHDWQRLRRDSSGSKGQNSLAGTMERIRDGFWACLDRQVESTPVGSTALRGPGIYLAMYVGSPYSHVLYFLTRISTTATNYNHASTFKKARRPGGPCSFILSLSCRCRFPQLSFRTSVSH
jgi:hypothetical protein